MRRAKVPADRPSFRTKPEIAIEEIDRIRTAGGRFACVLADAGYTLAATIKARWVCEQAHQQLKEELGLDHFEGRSWIGLHRHALMTMMAFAFLQYRRLAMARTKKKASGTATSAKPAGHQASHPRLSRQAATNPVSAL